MFQLVGRPTIAMVAIWAAWLLSWFLAAFWSRAARVHQPGVEQLRYGVFIWVGSIFLFGSPRVLSPLLRPVVPEPAAVAWAAVAVLLAGLAWTWWARIHLGSLWSSTVTLKLHHSVVRTGPYRITRHPIYTGLLLALLATAVIRDSWAALAGWLLVLGGFIVKLRQEERLLSTTLGAEYAAYKSHVPALVPRLW